MSEKEEADAIKATFREMGEYVLDPENVPRHPRGFQGPLEYVDTVPVIIARDPASGRTFAINPTELQEGKGETPQVDVFAQDYTIVGTRKGTSLVDVFFKLLPVVGGGGATGGGLLDLIGSVFGKKRRE